MKKRFISILAFAVIGLASCSYDRSPDSGNYDPNNPGFEYAPENDMYHSVPYDGYTQVTDKSSDYFNSNIYNPDSSNQRLPAAGTIARGKADFYYPYANTAEGYEKAGLEVKSPLQPTPEVLAEGKRLYEIYCWHCHGMTGKSDGPVMASGKFPKPGFGVYQSDYIRQLPVGKMYHTVTYGKNLMGPHGPLLSPKERWEIIHYVKQLSMAAGPSDKAAADSSATAKPGTNNTNSDTSKNNTVKK